MSVRFWPDLAKPTYYMQRTKLMIKRIKLNKASLSDKFLANSNLMYLANSNLMLCDKLSVNQLWVRYVSNSAQYNNPKDWAVGSETGNAHAEAVDSWDKVQCYTKDYFSTLKQVGSEITRPEVKEQINHLSDESRKLAKEAEDNCPAESDRDIIKNESETIERQSALLNEAENILDGIYNSQKKAYWDLKSTLDHRKKMRDESLEERQKYEDMWNEELDYEEEQRQIEEKRVEQEKQQVEQENQGQDEFSKGKRKLEVDLEEQGESSKRRQPEYSSPQQQGESSKGKQPESSSSQQQGESSKGKQPESSSSQENSSSAVKSPIDYVLSLPHEYDPFDDVGGD